jgi:TonB family protein
MLASTLVPAPAGPAPALARHPDAARRALRRNALLLSAVLHLAAGLGLSYALREGLGEAVATLAMRSRVVLVPPGPTDVARIAPAPRGPADAFPTLGIPVPVRGLEPHLDGPDLNRFFAPLAPVPDGSGAPGDAGAVTEGALPPPPETGPLPLDAPVDVAPQVVEQVDPVYPSYALEAGLTGTVLLHVLVGADGSVREIRVVDGSKVFIQAAVSAIARWRFSPARIGRHPVPIWVEVPVRFRL